MKKEKNILVLAMGLAVAISAIAANFISRQFAIYEAKEMLSSNSAAIVVFAIIAFAQQDNNMRLVYSH